MNTGLSFFPLQHAGFIWQKPTAQVYCPNAAFRFDHKVQPLTAIGIDQNRPVRVIASQRRRYGEPSRQLRVYLYGSVLLELICKSRKRLLLRIWIDLPEVRAFADAGRIRYGVIRHGKLGWSAADLLAGNRHTPHRRRTDGVPLVG